MTAPDITFVIPAYAVADCIATALRSITEPQSGAITYEIVVVDDGSPDAEALRSVLMEFPMVTLVVHDVNRGMCAGRNSGIHASTGVLVCILDADDELVPEWPTRLAAIRTRWPGDHPVCWAACVNGSGRTTVSRPDYTGSMSLVDLLHERCAGEYLPLFRGDFIRAKGYIDIGTRKSCGVISYIAFAEHGPFWIDAAVMRIYHDQRAGSVTAAWHQPDKASQSAKCFEELLRRYAPLYRSRAPDMLWGKHARLAVYRRFAGEFRGALLAWCNALTQPRGWRALAVLPLLMLGPLGVRPINWAKRLRFIKPYG